MGLIFYGTQETPINLDEFLIKCNSCETQSWADIIVTSKYYHVYWLPIIPIEKNADIKCKTCGLNRYGIPFDADLISNYNEIRHKFKHPFFTYIGVSIMLLFFIAIVYAMITE